MSRRIRRPVLSLFAATLTLALAACGGSGESGDGEPFVVAHSSAISTLNVGQEAGVANYQISSIIQDGLVALTNDGQLAPALATEWAPNADATEWVFTIRPDATFHDGTPVTIEDILFSIELNRDPVRSPGVSTYWPTTITGVEQTGDWEITFTLDTPSAYFASQISNSGGLFVTSEAFYEAAANFGSASDLVLGTGPYQVVEFDPTSHVLLERYDGYWGEKPDLQQIRIDFITDDNTRLLAFRDGGVDLALNVPANAADQWAAVDGATVQFYADRGYKGLMLDPTVEPFDDIHVRQAIAHAVDKASIVAGVLKGHAEVANALDSPEQMAAVATADEARAALAQLPAQDFDLAQAKAELAQSKVPDGFTAELTYPTGYPDVGEASLALADTLGQIGVGVTVKEIPLEQWLDAVGTGEWGLSWMIYGATTAIPNEIGSWLLAGGDVSWNPVHWDNPAAQAQLDLVGSDPDPKAQLAAIVESTRLGIEDAVYVPVYWSQVAVALGAGVAAPDFGSYSLYSNWPLLFTKS